MNQLKPKLPKLNVNVAVICYATVFTWLFLLSILLFKNLNLSNSLLNDSSDADQNLQIQSIEARVSGLSELIQSNFNSENDPFIVQSQLTNMQQELRERIALLGEQLSGFAPKTELATIKEQLQQQQALISELQTVKEKQTTLSTTIQPKSQAVKKKSVSTLPFRIIGVELRGGQQLLTILPMREQAINSVVLLAVGQSFANWKLESIEGRTATFKSGNQTHRLRIP